MFFLQTISENPKLFLSIDPAVQGRATGQLIPVECSAPAIRAFLGERGFKRMRENASAI